MAPEEKRSELDKKVEAIDNPKTEDVLEAAIELSPNAEEILEKSAKEIIEEFKIGAGEEKSEKAAQYGENEKYQQDKTSLANEETATDYYQPTTAGDKDAQNISNESENIKEGGNMNDDGYQPTSGGTPPPAGGTPPSQDAPGGSMPNYQPTTPPPADEPTTPTEPITPPTEPTPAPDVMPTPPPAPEPPTDPMAPTTPPAGGTDTMGTPPPPSADATGDVLPPPPAPPAA